MVSEVLVLIGILLSFNVIVPYSVVQYVGSGLIMFVSAEVLEGQEFTKYFFMFLKNLLILNIFQLLMMVDCVTKVDW